MGKNLATPIEHQVCTHRHRHFALLRNLVKDQGITVILTTHNLALGHQADRIITLEDGRIAKAKKSGLDAPPAS